MSSQGRGRGGGGGNRGGGRGKGTPQKEPQKEPPKPPTPSRPPSAATTSSAASRSTLEEEFPSLQVSAAPRPAWGPPVRPQAPVPQQQPPRQQPIQQPVRPGPVPQTSKAAVEKPSLQVRPGSAPQVRPPAPVPQQQPIQQPVQPVVPSPVVQAPKPAEAQEQTKSELISKEEEPSAKVFSSSVVFQSGEFPPKPAERGNLGRAIKLRTNHYQLALTKPFIVHQYDVELTKKLRETDTKEERLIKNKDLMRKMFLQLANDILPREYKNKLVYNFSKNLYSLLKLPFEESITYEIRLENSTFILKLQKINQIQIDPRRYNDPVTIQVLDLVFTQNFNYSCVNLNRSFFKEGAGDMFKLGFGLELWKGAYASVRPSEIGLTWNIDSANAAFLTSENLLEVAVFHYNCNYQQLKAMIEKDRDGNLIGVSFLEGYGNRDIKTKTGGFRKKIRGFGPSAASHKFDWKKPDNTVVKISVKDYLKQHYNIDLKFPDMPCVDLGRESYLPMELCSTELKNKKKLTETETQQMIKISAVPAPDRMNYIQNWAQRSDIQSDPILKEYNINLNLRLLELDGRVLEPPDVKYTDRFKTMSKQIGEKGAWDHRNYKFNSCVKVKRWIVINFAFRVKDDAAYNFIDKLIEVGRIHGIEMSDPVDYISDTRRNRDEDVRRIFENVAVKYKPLDLIVVIFGGTTNAYKIMKTSGDLTYGIPTQGVEDKNVNRISDQTISNILLKINTKLGGINFVLSRENRLFAQYIQQLYSGPLMIFGADVTHPSPGDMQVTESIAAVVGSIDNECCFYAARLYAQKAPKGQAYEMIHDLDKMFISLVQEYFNANKVYPKKIVFYRDGVSEGQFSLVLRHEMNKIRSACIRINPGYKPAITFVIVQKRHHTRLFPVNPRDQNGRAMNVPPGTVVDRAIVTPNMFDFFLCSHVGIQGTSRPCRYFVLHDDNNFSMNQMQILSHYLCHVYSRCARSVSYPAPAYYSHLAAFRGRDYFRKTVPSSPNAITSYEIQLHPDIRNKMFYS